MSYQVLARKWRPRTFREMVGQEHVLQALINALDHNRLHHAYLFTGTRGVGKTTIARILAKCLNCETGVSSEPCGQCSACTEINEGRFVDLIEVDAASRTKVEDTRELLENVQYAPTRGRYKVYLIDEVHMLSIHSFNALLKTLEEPPPHIKFLLATTDPQKLPVTILSRCLQFNLKNMNPERIVEHLQFVLEQEMVPFEESALWHLGRAADGSMRDAMSLTDQAISYGSGKVTEGEVRAMLGTIDQALVYEIVTALAALDGQQVLAAVEHLSEHAPDYAGALAELLSVLHRVAIAQVLPEAVSNSVGDRDRILALAQQMPSEDVQLFYQTALLGRRDLPMAPDPRSGFEMVLLRMLAFKPQGVPELPSARLPQSAAPSPGQRPEAPPVAQEPDVPPSPIEAPPPPVAEAPDPQRERSEADPVKKPEVSPVPAERSAPDAPLSRDLPRPALEEVAVEPPRTPVESVSPAQEAPSYPEETVRSEEPSPPEVPPSAELPPIEKLSLEQACTETWTQIYLGLGVGGVLQATASNCMLAAREGNLLQFVLEEANSTLYDQSHQGRLADLLSQYFGAAVEVRIQLGKVSVETPAATAIRLRQERQAEALAAMQNDPIVQQLMAQFSATLQEETVEPIDQ